LKVKNAVDYTCDYAQFDTRNAFAISWGGKGSDSALQHNETLSRFSETYKHSCIYQVILSYISVVQDLKFI
jgi:hypothetical protein